MGPLVNRLNKETRMSATHFTLINGVLNWVNEKNQPECNPLARMFLTRLGGVVCLVTEAVTVVFNALKALQRSATNVFSFTRRSFLMLCCCMCGRLPRKEGIPMRERFRTRILNICKLVVGIASTIFFGIVFSPMLNFKIHIKLKIAVDMLAEKRRKEQVANDETLRVIREVEEGRAKRFAEFLESRQLEKEAKEQENAIDAHLAELLIPSAG